MLKTITVNTLLLLSSAFLFNSCSKSDDSSSPDYRESPSALIAGTYIGVYGKDDFNKKLFVENIGNNKVRLTGNDKTPVELEVEYFDSENILKLKDVKHKTGDRIGVLVYKHDLGTLGFSGYKIKDNQKVIFFNGKKDTYAK